MTVWRLDRAKRSDAVKMKQRYNLGRYHQGKRRNTNRGVEKELRELKEMYGEENIISAVIRVDETATPHLHCDFVPIDQAGIWRRKT